MKRLLLLSVLAFVLLVFSCKPQVSEQTFTSTLRPDELIRLNEIYSDTLEFVAMGKTIADSVQTSSQPDSLWVTLKKGDRLYELPLSPQIDLSFTIGERLVVDWKLEQTTQLEDANPQYSELVIGLKTVSFIEELTPGYTLKHFFMNNIRLAAFFDNGFTFRSAKDGVNSHYFDVEPLKLTPSDIDYEEWDTFLAIGKVGIWDFFDETSHIIPGWQLIYYYRVFSPLQATFFVTNLSGVSQNNVRVIKNSCLILLPHIEDTEEEDDSFVIEESFTEEETIDETPRLPTASDRVRYERETIAKFAQLDIPAVKLTVEERYISFILYDSEWIFIDTQEEQNGRPYAALLYEVGYIPIIIDIKGNEEDDEIIERYITQAREGYKPFPQWKSMMVD